MAYDSNNIFAKILRGEIPAVKVYEDDHVLAFLDVMPQAEGHTLVIPKQAAQNIFELSPDGAAHLIQAVQKIAPAVKAVTGAPGIMLAQLNGEAAGQSVFHIHFHIIPRFSGVDLQFHPREMADPKKQEALAAKIRAAL
ncbi:MAG: HIT family protein [Rhizomicrobium sp.]